MSTIRKLALAFVLIVAIVGCAPAPTPQVVPTPMPQTTQPALPQQIQIVQPEKRSIFVAGEGEMKVKPDMAELRIGIETESGTVTVAKKENDTITKKVMAAIQKYEIDEKDIKTTYLSIYPNTDYRSSAITGYTVYNSIKLTIRDLTIFEAVLSDVLDAGANHLDVDFTVSDLEKYQAQARELALKAAMDKASEMAKTLGQEIGIPLSIQEVTSNDQIRYPSSAFMLSAFGLEDISTIAFGQITIKAAVTVEFELK